MTRFSEANRRSGTASLALAVCFTLPLAFTMVGCGGGSGSVGSDSPGPAPAAQGQGRATFAVRWPERESRLIPILANSIVIVVRGADGQIAGNATLNRSGGGGAALVSSAIINPLPTGGLMVTATAYPEPGGGGVAQAAATAPLAIRANSNTEIRMTLQSTIERLEAVSASPNVGVAYSTQIAATARDAAGNVVLTSPGKLRFELLSDPNIARLDTATGTLTGITVGSAEVRITDTESGKSAVASVKVSRSAAYRLTWIAPLPNLPYVLPEAVNGNGEVVGVCLPTPAPTSTTSVGFYWKPGADGGTGQITAIPVPDGSALVRPASLNDRGQVVGTAETFGSGQRFRAFLWQNGQTTVLTEPVPGQNYQAFDINAAGDILGSTVVILQNGATATRPCIWRGGVPSIVSQTNFSQSSTLGISAINDSGSFVGRFIETFSAAPYAARWSPDSSVTKLPFPTGSVFVNPADINGSGQIAGYYSPATGSPGTGSVLHGFLVSGGRFTTVLPLPNLGHNNLVLSGVASDGTAVGHSGVVPNVPIFAGSAARAVRWRYGVTEELTKLLPANTALPLSLLQATAASGPGHIVGTGVRGETPQAFLLTPQGGTGGASVGVN